MESLLPILLIPFIWALIAKRIFHRTINWQEMSIMIVIAMIAGAAAWGTGLYRTTQDVEILNGQVTSKHRVHDQYTESYDCFCSTTCSGTGTNKTCSELCQTCYREHYTVDWSAKTTVGKINFDSLDETSSSVYKTPDPSSYSRCKPGEPASAESTYTNYVKAAPESLFHLKSKTDAKKPLVPPYPGVFDFYRLNRVLYVGNSSNELPANFIPTLNKNISDILRTLGPTKQVNVIVILTDNPDASYRYEVENQWLGGKKNDVIIFYSVKAGELQWVDVMTWARNHKNELFQVKLRDTLLEAPILNADALTAAISSNILKYYDRPHMSEFKYLKDSIEPPFYVLVIAYLLVIAISIGLTFWFHRENITPFSDIISDILNRNGRGSRFTSNNFSINHRRKK